MTRFFRYGFTLTLHQPFSVILLFLYQAGWGIILYKLIQSFLLPLMHRYPGTEQSGADVQLFLAEAQFQLFKTDLIHPYLWWLSALLVIRILLTPLLSAGVYYSLAHQELNAGYRFVNGIRQLALPFFITYVVQLTLTLFPLIWLLPKLQAVWSSHSSYMSALSAMLPWLMAYLLYNYILRLCFMYVQFTLVSRTPLMSFFAVFLHSSWPIVVTAGILLILSGLLLGTAITVSYIWTGFAALLIYQLYPFCKMFLHVWTIAAQFQLWTSSTSSK
jgi:hypothetical protein